MRPASLAPCSYEALGGTFGPILEFPPECSAPSVAHGIAANQPTEHPDLMCNITGAGATWLVVLCR